MFEALHGVSFNVKPGEIVGIIGKNGSGKSTMLRAIGGIFLRMKGLLICMDTPYPCCLLALDFRKADWKGKYPAVRNGTGI